jgi:hypothetical protein
MKLQELLNTPYAGKIKHHDGLITHRSIATINGKHYAFDAVLDRAGRWELSFVQYQPDSTGKVTLRFDNTGAGDELKVFQFVLTSVKEFIKDKDPEELVFTAVADDKENRAGLYRKLVKRFGKGWTTVEDEFHGEVRFTMARGPLGPCQHQQGRIGK